MLGVFLRLKIAIALAVLGLLLLGTGIGQRTIWRPPAQLTASVPAGVAPAPLTVISPDLLKTRDGQFSMTVKGTGPIQLAVARERDIAGWIGDAAHTTIGAANNEFTALSSASTEGAAEVPNPAGSDMWVAEEKATGELNYTWQAPGHGDWALLLSSDGKSPAPIDISVTVDNTEGTPWAVPLMIVGSALLALAALLFLLVPRKTATVEAVPGRRAAGRTPADPATGALEVDKLVAARESAKAATAAAAAAPAPATIADVHKAEAGTPSSSERKPQGAGASSSPMDSDATSALPRILHNPNAAAGPEQPSAETAAGTGKPLNAEKDPDKKDPGKKDSNTPGDDSKPGSGGGSTGGGGSAGVGAAKAKDKDKGGAKGTAKGRDGGKNLSVKTRWGAALAALLLAGSVGPAVAETTTPAETSPVESPAATGTPPATETATVGFPNLLASQVERIATSVATTVASGDNAKDAQELEPRVAGMALAVRTANYQIRAAVEKEAAPEPVNATKLLANVVTTTAAWPRSAMIVTQGEDNALPQLLTLVQASARENYKMVQTTPLLPGQTFPKADKEGTKEVALDSAEGLAMSPEAAVAAFSDRLSKKNSKFAATFKDSVYVTSVLDLQKQLLTDAKDADYVFSHKGDLDAAVAVRTADGGAMVVVGNNFGIDATSKLDATLTVGDDAAVFTGGKETTTGFNLNYAEPVVMYIPPAGGDTQLTVLSATRALVGASFK